MTPNRLLDHFERISEALDALPRLRRFILDLAVRGKLVEQDPNDEPASELLKRIQAEKARLVKEGRLRVEKPLRAIDQEETDFDTPQSWKWVRLGEIIKLWSGYAFRSSDFQADGVPVIRIGDLQSGKVVLDSAVRVPHKIAVEVGPEVWIPPDALLIAMSGATTGKVAFNRSGTKLLLNQRVGRIEVFQLSVNFIRFFFETIIARNLSISFGTAIPNLSAQQINETAFPLPPLAEQHRIVAKVDELMALCDRLETAQAERESRRDKLAAASLHRLNNGADADEFREHARFHFNQLPRLTTRPEHIQQLRQAILNLAVRGKLVPQDPSDEPASELLKSIEAARKSPLRVSKANEDKLEVLFFESEFPFDLPEIWKWVPFGLLPIEAAIGIDRGRQHQGPDKLFGYFKMNNIRNSGGVDLTNLTRIDADQDEVNAFSLADRDFLFNTRNSRELVGKTCVYRSIGDDTLLYNNNILRAKFMPGFAPEFVDYWFRSSLGRRELETLKSNTTNVCAIYQGKLFGFPCPLPPLAEQHRIVAKVDELLALSDRLEVQLTTTQTESRRLLEAVLHEALNGNRELEQGSFS